MDPLAAATLLDSPASGRDRMSGRGSRTQMCPAGAGPSGHVPPSKDEGSCWTVCIELVHVQIIRSIEEKWAVVLNAHYLETSKSSRKIILRDG